MKIWKFRNQSDKGPCPAGWADKLGVPQVVADLLWQRGLETSAQMDSFLSPGLRHLAPPDCWPGMQEAVDALEQGIREGRNVLIWGDYDVDGITGATLILQTLRFHDVPSTVHLPDRRKEGYGLNIPEIERLAAEEGPGILLTVDCGISDVKAVERARELGFMVVVSDHHMPPEELPRIPLVLRESGSGTLEVIAAALAARGIRLSQFDVTMRLGSTEGIKAFVRNSDAMAIVSVISVVDELRSGALRIVDIEGLTLSRDFVFVHAEAEPARLARRFIDFARADF